MYPERIAMLSKLILLAAIALTACRKSENARETATAKVQELPATNNGTETNAESKPGKLSRLFSLADAERILGQRAYLSDSSTTRNDAVLTYKCAFTANSEDMKVRKAGVVYFLAERYNQVSAARQKYTFIKEANEGHGIKILHDLGDEAYFHSDGENFYFIMVRKGSCVVTMKVNKITGTTSLDAFQEVVRKIAAVI
jgi:hypothetical protein